MTAALIAPVIPSVARPAGHGGGRAGTARRLPLASPSVSPPPPGDVVYGIGRIDASGRVGDRAVTPALGWRYGDRLGVEGGAVAGHLEVGIRDPGGGCLGSGTVALGVLADHHLVDGVAEPVGGRQYLK